MDFAHGTLARHADNIQFSGLNRVAATAAFSGGSMARPGYFHTFRVYTWRLEPGLSNAAEYASIRAGFEKENGRILVGRLPDKIYRELRDEGLIFDVRIPGVTQPQMVMHPESYELVNQHVKWLACLTTR